MCLVEPISVFYCRVNRYPCAIIKCADLSPHTQFLSSFFDKIMTVDRIAIRDYHVTGHLRYFTHQKIFFKTNLNFKQKYVNYLLLFFK